MHRLTCALVPALFFASIAGACGPATTPPSTPPPASSAQPFPPSSAAPPVSGTPPATKPPEVEGPASVGHMKGPIGTSMAAELQAMGIDLAQLPPIAKLEPKKLRDVMKLFARSLGVKCVGCHVEGDFAAPTKRKRIAAKMWDEFTRGLAMADGSKLFCDSCHQGAVIVLDRRDKKALGKWMDDHYVSKLKQRAGGDHGCEASQCHGKDLDYRFLAKWAGERAAAR